MPNEKWRMDLKGDIEAVVHDRINVLARDDDIDALLLAVLPHLEAAFERGKSAAKLRQGSRLMEENERLRRELRRQIPNPRKESE